MKLHANLQKKTKTKQKKCHDLSIVRTLPRARAVSFWGVRKVVLESLAFELLLGAGTRSRHAQRGGATRAPFRSRAVVITEVLRSAPCVRLCLHTWTYLRDTFLEAALPNYILSLNKRQILVRQVAPSYLLASVGERVFLSVHPHLFVNFLTIFILSNKIHSFLLMWKTSI